MYNQDQRSRCPAKVETPILCVRMLQQAIGGGDAGIRTAATLEDMLQTGQLARVSNGLAALLP